MSRAIHKYKYQYQLCNMTAAVAFTTLLSPQAAWPSNINHAGTGDKPLLISAVYQHPTAKVAATPLVKVPFRCWLPKKEKPRLILFCIHGLGLSSKSFDNFGRRMALSGIPTYALDVRGFGGWMKDPENAHVDFEACLSDIEQGLKTLHKAYPGLPVFLVGESMGGAIAIQAAGRYPDLVNGLVSAVPSSVARSGSFLKSGVVIVFESLDAPTGQANMAPVIVDKAVANPKVRAKIKDEPLNRSKLTKGEMAKFEKFMDDTHDCAPLVERTPTMVLVAYKDKLVSPDGSLDLLSEMTTPMKLMIVDGNSGHLMLEEQQMTPDVERLLKSWLQDQAAKAVLLQGSRAKVSANSDLQEEPEMFVKSGQTKSPRRLNLQLASG
ncbi:alpha/beta fold hydrolase [bacterium]|nr:alpha/beta fold hydrolase [bacterium]MBP9807088.1 alpha/beta fold hydrolase [bacterium]